MSEFEKQLIDRIKVLEVKPGDILVAEIPVGFSREAISNVQASLQLAQRKYGLPPIMCLYDGVELSVIRQKDLENQPQTPDMRHLGNV